MNKGFTLIELLAVILILSIIALIAVPTVNSIIEESKIGAEKSSANNLVSAAEKYEQLCMLKEETCITDFTTLIDANIKSTLGIKGDIPKISEITTFSYVDGKINLIYTKNGITCTVTESQSATCTK